MLLLDLFLLFVLFFSICYLNTGSDEKNIRSFYTYPDEIQSIVQENPELSQGIRPFSPASSLLANTLLFTGVLFLFGLPLRQTSFWGNFISLSILGQGLNLFDLLVIDLLWWRNSSRVRFSGTEEMSELYRNPAKHIRSFLRAIPVFLIAAAVDGLLLSRI